MWVQFNPVCIIFTLCLFHKTKKTPYYVQLRYLSSILNHLGLGPKLE